MPSQAGLAGLAAAVPGGIRDCGVRAVDRLESLLRRWAAFAGELDALNSAPLRIWIWIWIQDRRVQGTLKTFRATRRDPHGEFGRFCRRSKRAL